jgi:outer membrane protein OmpA-like peptidoglycan-associated protein
MKKALSTIAILAVIAVLTLSGCHLVPPVPALTIAVTATSHDPAATLGPVTQMVADHAEGALLPGDGKVTVVTPDRVEIFDLTPMRGKNVESVSVKRGKLIAENISSLEDSLGKAEATAEGLDVVAVLDRALEQTPDGGRVILESSGFSTAAPLDLNQAGDWMGKPGDLVQATKRTDLPNAAGKHITFVGLGYPNPASDQEQAGPAARTALTTVMLGLCAKMGAASCDTVAGSAGHEPAVATNKVAPVVLDRITTHCVGQTNIDTSLAFSRGSFVILPAADKALTPIADSFAKCPAGSIINAIGYSAMLPGEAPNGGATLERARAKAILTRLVELGAPASIIGTAAPGGQIVDNLPGGIFNETLAAKNRTVILTAE